ncbi:MAG: aminotransferase class III-fold pyridoxal phosphate-dependent enzyme [Ilumatobacteraceae bacterium]|nr:aminotransferase class III-fold pyridoxal phosphate-dependent enzyme [Ilumatobacteraceae bacterium]
MIDRQKLAAALKSEEQLFRDIHPKSMLLAQSAKTALLSGVPMPWMTRWPGSFPLHVQQAHGARFIDVDDIEYVDFCLGDTGAMTGHALHAVAQAVSQQAQRGLTTMLPTSDAQWVAQNLAQRFGVAKWQFAISATDANRFVLRFARMLTGRPKIVVHDWCYHGSVDETLVIRDAKGNTISRPGAIGPQVDPALTTRVVPFNDLVELERVLAIGDVACVLIEPALTNIGIVLPQDGYIQGVRDITRKYEVLLVVDETHTICAGPGGCTKLWNIDPDFVVIGKTIGGGIPVGAYGMTAEIALHLEAAMTGHDVDVSGVGGTLSGSALAMSAMKATLSNALTQEDFDQTIPLATRWTQGVERVCVERNLDWHVQQLGCRAEYWFCTPPVDGAQAAAAVDPMLESFLHLFCLNRGVLLAPFHNMALMSPFHSAADVDKHTEVFALALDAIITA